MKAFLLLIGLLSLNNAKAVVDVSITPSGQQNISYGDSITGITLVLEEHLLADPDSTPGAFGVTTDGVVKILPPAGYRIYCRGDLQWQNLDAPDISRDITSNTIDNAAGDSVYITYSVGGGFALERFTVTGISLIPVDGQSYYGTSILITNGEDGNFDFSTDTVSVGNFVMDDPSISLNSIDYKTADQCSSNDIEFFFTVSGVSELDSIDNVYCNTTSITSYNSPQVNWNSNQFNFTTDIIHYSDSYFYVILNFASGWSHIDSLSVGDFVDGTKDIRLSETDIVERYDTVLAVSKYVGSKNIDFLITDYKGAHPRLGGYENSAFITINDSLSPLTIGSITEYNNTTNKEHYISPPKAGPGTHKFLVQRSNEQNSCVSTDTIEITVIPDIISTESVFCYLNDTAAEVKVAYDAIKANDNIEVRTSFNHLKFIYGDVSDDRTVPDRVEDGFYIFEFNPTDIYETVSPPGTNLEEVSLSFELWTDIDYYAPQEVVVYDYYHATYEYIQGTLVNVFKRCDYIYDHSLSNGVEHYHVTCYNDVYTKELTIPASRDSETTEVVRPLGNGVFLNLETAYCPRKNSISLSSNYIIDTITSSYNAHARQEEQQTGHEYWTYTPYDVWQNNALSDTNSPSIYYDTGEIVDTVTLWYTDSKGCYSDTSYYIHIMADSLVDKSGTLNLEDKYCPVEGQVLMQSNFTNVDSITGRSIVDSSGGRYFFIPLNLYDSVNQVFTATEEYDTIRLYYNDNNGCPYMNSFPVVLNPKPQLSFTASNLCLGDTTLLSTTLTNIGASSVEQWEWDFGDGFSFSNAGTLVSDTITELVHGGRTIGRYSLPQHVYDVSDLYTAFAKVTLSTGCYDTDTLSVVVGDKPNVGFGFSNKLITEPTLFTNSTSSLSIDTVATYEWNFGDAALNNGGMLSTSSSEPINVNYETPGVHVVTLNATTQNGCSSDTVLYVPSFEVIEVTPDSLYSEGFSGSLPTNWIASKEYTVGQASSWKYVPVSGAFVDDKHTSGNMWLVGDYNDSTDTESGWLESPCFDISELTFPLLSLDIFQSIENRMDGAVLQYTTDDGASWQTLGSDETGAEWFNTGGIWSEPGKEDNGTNTGWLGWSENTKTWATARHSLEEARDDNGVGCVRFRIAYSSNSFHSDEFIGFGVDNVLISQRDRIILLEEFVNSEMPTATPLDENIDEFMVDHQVEVCDMRYHMVNGHDADVLSKKVNWQDVSSRASEYGALSSGPTSVMDGVVKGNLHYDVEFSKRTLTDPTFKISDVQVTKDGGQMNISASVKLVNDYMQEFYGEHRNLVRVAIVQKEMADDDGNVYNNVVVELLPSGSGNVVEYLEPDFAVGETLEINASWVPNVRTIDNEYRVVIYVQAEWGFDEVQQVYFEDVDPSVVPEVYTGVSTTSFADGFSVYPNPVYNELFISLNGEVAGDVNWNIYTVSGKSVKQGTILNGDNVVSIPVSELASGLYVVELIQEDGSRASIKISKN